MSVYNSENKVVKSCGELTHFEFSFKIFKEEDLTVSLINPTTQALTNLKLNEDYKVFISRVNDGGSIELMEKHNGYNIYIYREIEIIQPHEIPTEGYFPELTIENALDRSCMIDQQLHEVVTRCVKLPGFSDITEIGIEPPINGKTLVWAVNNGKATIKNSNYSPDSIAETVENAAKQALQKANEAQEAATTATEQAAIAVENAQSVVNRATTSLDNLTADGDARFDCKVNTDGSNLTNVSNAFKAKIVSWGIPDYDSRINTGKQTPYTAPCDGLFVYTNNSTDSYMGSAFVNGFVVSTLRSYTTDCFPVAKNDVISLANTPQITTTYFVPMKGEINTNV